MSRLFVLGSGPLPVEPSLRLDASNLRTWHLTKPLLAKGHEVRLIAVADAASYTNDVVLPHEWDRDGLSYLAVDQQTFHERDWLQDQHDRFAPDAVIGINTYPSFRAASLETDVPMWCDLNGWCMAEAQTKAAVFDDDIYLSHFWRMESRILDRADRLSTVSQAQKFAVIGELASRGRLNASSCGYEFCEAVPNGTREDPVEEGDRALMRGRFVPDDAFVVFWLGGYNTWTDVDTLMAGLNQAMSRNERIVYVSTGGALKGHDEKTFERMGLLVDRSPWKDRFHFLGWVPTADVPRYLKEADLGLNLDDLNYETVFGARNRINEMIRHGLAVLTTRGSEISADLERENAALTIPVRSPERLAESILWAAENPTEMAAIETRAHEFAKEAYSYESTTRGLQRFAERPERAPDHGARVIYKDVDFFRGRTDSPLLLEADPESKANIEELERYIEQIHSSRFWRLWMAIHRVRRGIGL